jgi:EmrB/QacA subfamily drug resistance transporter
MAFIDGTAVNVALPALQTSLKASLLDVQWVVEAYTLFLGALLLTGGSIGDLFGTRNVFVLGVLIFGAASAWCGLAPNIHQLILARSVQGIGGALLVPNSLALLSVSFSRKDLGKAIGIWSGATSITSAVGPLLGGFLAEHASWRWVFAVNLPIAAAVVAIALLRIPRAEPKEGHAKVDWAGTVLATLGLGGLVYGLLQSSWPFWVGGLLLLIVFVITEWRERNPMLPLSLFRSPDFTGTGLLTLLLYGALSGALFFLPIELVEIQGYGATGAGFALLPFIVLMALLSRWSAGLLDRFPAKLLLLVGPLIAGLGFLLFAVPDVGGSYWVTFFPAIVVLGFGMAVTVAPLTTTVVNSVDRSRSGVASGVNNALSRVAGLITIALFGIALRAGFDRHFSRLFTGASKQQIDSYWSSLATGAAKGHPALAAQESFVSGFRLVMFLSAALCLAGAMVAATFIGKQQQPR